MLYDLRFSLAERARSWPLVAARNQRFPVSCGPSTDQGHELGRCAQSHGRQPRYVINHSNGRWSRRCERRRLPRGLSGVAEGEVS
jgi:hypothetical protein